MPKNLRLIAIVFGLLIAIVALVAVFFIVFRPEEPAPYTINLEVWGVFDDSDAYTELFAEYQRLNPHIGTIEYRKLPIETYKQDLLNALAAGKGPDVFMVRNVWTTSFADKVAPAPENFTEKGFRDAFVDVAAEDFIVDGKIYGAPLSVDSLALYYNKDLFNAAGIPTPPTTWEELAEDARRISRLDATGDFAVAGAALGTAQNINRSTDIVSALISQYGADLNETAKNRLAFSGSDVKQAVAFYTSFSDIQSPNYTWNPREYYSLDAFSDGSLGMMLNYSWHYATLKQKNAKLNVGVAPLPQIPGGTNANFANYWGYAVSKNKTQPEALPGSKQTLDPNTYNALRTHEAWQLLRYLTYPHPQNTLTLANGLSQTTADFALAFDPAEEYLKKTAKPAARRDLIEKQKNDPVLAPFGTGNLIAKTWRQADPEANETVLADMIESIVTGVRSVDEALETAAARLNTPGALR